MLSPAEQQLVSEIVELGMPPPIGGENHDKANSKILEALLLTKSAVKELAMLTDVSILLTSPNAYLRKLGKELTTSE